MNTVSQYSKMNLVTIKLESIQVGESAGHQLRGYFANHFSEVSPLFHNHLDGERFLNAYPRVQYKVIGGTPTILGINEGGVLLNEIFIDIEKITVGNRDFPVTRKSINRDEYKIGMDEKFNTYLFATPWLALNAANYKAYRKADAQEQKRILKGALTQNILSFCKGINHYQAARFEVDLELTPHRSKYKNQDMLSFVGGFRTTMSLPHMIGLGKGSARGFGTIQRV